MDAMALVRKYGKPDIFLTMTCNPNWDEIKNELYPGQTPQDRPDLITRVFRANLDAMRKMLMEKVLTPFLGTCLGWQDRVAVRCGLLMKMVADEGEVECD